jgi:hypothetical protein
VGWRPKCGHCLKAGHVWAQCPVHLSKDEKTSKSTPYPSFPATIAANMELPSTGQANNSVTPTPFILSLKDHSVSILSTLSLPAGMLHVDSTLTAHMEPEISHFFHYTKLHKPIHVTLANEHVILAPGWGQ